MWARRQGTMQADGAVPVAGIAAAKRMASRKAPGRAGGTRLAGIGRFFHTLRLLPGMFNDAVERIVRVPAGDRMESSPARLTGLGGAAGQRTEALRGNHPRRPAPSGGACESGRGTGGIPKGRPGPMAAPQYRRRGPRLAHPRPLPEGRGARIAPCRILAIAVLPLQGEGGGGRGSTLQDPAINGPVR